MLVTPPLRLRVDAPRNALMFAALYSAFWVIIPGGRILMRENLQLAASTGEMKKRMKLGVIADEFFESRDGPHGRLRLGCAPGEPHLQR